MGIFFTADEIFDVAIGMEKNGIDFYTRAAGSSKNKDVNSLYTYLIEEEKNHLQYFQTSKQSVGTYLSPDALDDDYAAYLKALVDSSVFTPEKSAEAALSSNEKLALDFALSIERESILFYLEMRPLMSRAAKGSIDRIIKEERSHVERLSAMKEKLRK